MNDACRAARGNPGDPASALRETTTMEPLTPRRRRLRRVLNFPWSAVATSIIAVVVPEWQGWPWWSPLALALILIIPMLLIETVITGTIWGGRDFWRESPEHKEFRRKLRELR
jgi:hypothetical protein